MSQLSRAQEAGVAVLTGVFGAPIGAAVYWAAFNEAICEPDFLSGSRECVVTMSGESRSWLELATTPAAVVFGFVLAGVVYLVLDVVMGVSKKPVS